MSEEREHACAQADALMGVFGFKRVVGDRQLLVLAARAAGIKIVDCGCRHEEWPFKYAEGQGRRGHWNPLMDDGDALRLAVLLRIETLFFECFGEVHATHTLKNVDDMDEPLGHDDYAATRRAIVRAAAAIGESM